MSKNEFFLILIYFSYMTQDKESNWTTHEVALLLDFEGLASVFRYSLCMVLY